MRKHGLLLSLLALLLAVFTTACDNSSSKGASINDPSQGGILKPVLSVSATQVGVATYKFTGSLSYGDVNDYTFTWNFGDGSNNVEGLEVEHAFRSEGYFTVVLSAEPKNENIAKPQDASFPLTFTTTGIVVTGVVVSNTSSPLDFQFQINAYTIDGSTLTYDWNFGDGETVTDGGSIATHTYGKYNKTYDLTAVVRSSNGKSLKVAPIALKTSELKAVVTVVNNPVNPKNKTFSVNFYDENDELIHGTSPSGDVEGLTNIKYNWSFGDNEYDNNTTSREVSHTYTSGTSSEYTVTLTATTDNYEGTITGTAKVNVDLAYSLPLLTASLTGDYGLTLEASAQGNGGAGYADKEVTYRFTFPDGTTKNVNVTHDSEGNVATPVTASVELQKYYPNYNVTVEVLDGGATIADGSVTAKKPTFEYVLNITAGSSYKNKTFTVTPKDGSFTLKNASFAWNFGDGATQNGSEASVNHTYDRIGTFNASVTISSPLLADTGITVKQVTGSITITSSITVTDFNCKTNGAEFDFLQYTCSVNAESTGEALTYKWYVDNVLQNNQTGKSFTKKYDKYNKVYNIKVEVGVQGIAGVQPVTKLFQLGTPAVYATISGPDNLVHGETGTYKVVTKVTQGNTTKEINLQNATYTFKIAENNISENNGSNKTWSRLFEPTNDQYAGKLSVTRTVRAEITGSSVNSKVTSSAKATTISKVDSTLNHFQSAVVSCSPANNINLVKQQCKVTVTVKNGVQGLTGNFNQYKAKLTSQGVTKQVTFGSKEITAGASQVSSVVTFEYNWPNGGDVVTGQPKTSNFTVTGFVFKGTDESKKLNATSANININLNIDYVLFPYTTGLEGQYGGTGYSFSTWSCGYGGKYEENVIPRKCPASNASMSGQTLKLGHLVDNNGNLKAKTKFEWYIRINKTDGNNVPATLVKAFNVEAGKKPTDDNLNFNIVQAMGYKKFIGSAYNNTNNVFYLKITPADDASAKPIRVWYNGSNKTNYGYRLQKITPIVRNGNSCKVLFEYPNMYYPTIRYIQIYLKGLQYNLDGAARYNSSDTLIPSSEYAKIQVTSNIFGMGSSWERHYANDYTTFRSVSGSNNGGWSLSMSESIYKLSRNENARGNTNIDMTRSNANVKLVFKDMLSGSGNQLITDYYKPVTCSIDQSVK